MDVIWSIPPGHSYFANSDYLVIKIWVSTAIQHSDTAILTRPKVYNFTIFFPEIVVYTLKGVACHNIVSIVDLAYCFVITAYAAP